MLAAAAVVIAATVVVGNLIATAVTAATEQQKQNDDPPAVIATEAVVIHNQYLQKRFAAKAAHSKVFQSIKKVRIYRSALTKTRGENSTGFYQLFFQVSPFG